MVEQEFELRTDSKAFPLQYTSYLANIRLHSKIVLEGWVFFFFFLLLL